MQQRSVHLSDALEQIRAAAGRAAKNNRLKREAGEILDKLKEELASDSKAQPRCLHRSWKARIPN